MKTQEKFEEAQRFFVKGEYEESVKAFSRAIEAGADPALGYLSRGMAYIRLNKMDEAIRDFGKTIEADPGNMRGYYYRGIGYMAKDDNESALPDFNKALELNPEHGGAHLARGMLYGLIGDDEKSVKDMKTAIIKSEAQIQGFSDNFGVLRTQFNKAMAHLSGERSHDPSLDLTPDEIEQVKKWIEAA